MRRLWSICAVTECSGGCRGAEVADFVRARDIAEVIEAGAGSDMMSGRGGADTCKIGAWQAQPQRQSV